MRKRFRMENSVEIIKAELNKIIEWAKMNPIPKELKEINKWASEYRKMLNIN